MTICPTSHGASQPRRRGGATSEDDSSERDLVGTDEPDCCATDVGGLRDRQELGRHEASPTSGASGTFTTEDQRGVRRYVAQQAGVGATGDQPVGGLRGAPGRLRRTSDADVDVTAVVRPWRARISCLTMLASVAASTAEVGSTANKTDGWARTARASRTRCRCPPDRLPPPEATLDANPSGRAWTSLRRRSDVESPQHLAVVDVVPASYYLSQSPGEQGGVVVGDERVSAERDRVHVGDRSTVPRGTWLEAAEPVDKSDSIGLSCRGDNGERAGRDRQPGDGVDEVAAPVGNAPTAGSSSRCRERKSVTRRPPPGHD